MYLETTIVYFLILFMTGILLCLSKKHILCIPVYTKRIIEVLLLLGYEISL